jgi:hypothetical protein
MANRFIVCREALADRNHCLPESFHAVGFEYPLV